MNLSKVIIPQIYKIKIPKAGDWFVCTKHLKQYIASPFISKSTHLSQIIRKSIVVNINSSYENFGNAVSIPHREAQNFDIPDCTICCNCVSIPHREAQNCYRNALWCFASMFQSLIGKLKTGCYITPLIEKNYVLRLLLVLYHSDICIVKFFCRKTLFRLKYFYLRRINQFRISFRIPKLFYVIVGSEIIENLLVPSGYQKNLFPENHLTLKYRTLPSLLLH
jgi:hypothetical protein